MDKHCHVHTWWRVDFLKGTAHATEVTTDTAFAIPQHMLIARCGIRDETTCPSTASSKIRIEIGGRQEFSTHLLPDILNVQNAAGS